MTEMSGPQFILQGQEEDSKDSNDGVRESKAGPELSTLPSQGVSEKVPAGV